MGMVPKTKRDLAFRAQTCARCGRSLGPSEFLLTNSDFFPNHHTTICIDVLDQFLEAIGGRNAELDKKRARIVESYIVVGYSEQGPFNTPVYVKDPQTFVAMFGGINKKLEKRGIFFHRLALQMLQVSPCLVLNLKKFKNETVGGATISSDFNPTANPIDTVELNVEDIYDTTRFWTLEAYGPFPDDPGYSLFDLL